MAGLTRRALVPAVSLAAAVAAAACSSKGPAGPPTPEEVAGEGTAGQVYTVEGTVHALTYDNRPGNGYPILPDRFVLFRSERPPGVTMADLDTGHLQAAWALGARLPEATLATGPLPQLGDRVRVTGTLQRIAWAGQTVPVLEDATVELPAGTLALGMVDAACNHDLDCHDRLVCDRATSRCAPPAEAVTWGEDWRNLHGTCTSDTDCPLPQVCDDRYTTTDTGPYAPPYFVGRDAGKHLCALPDGTDAVAACPRTVSSADVTGGRFVNGKEVCVDTEVWLPVQAPDGDTHLQVVVDEPLPYPASDSAYYVAGAATEISPPYKDPARPQGALLDPERGDRIVLVGTTRYDDGHGWFEIHSVKAYTVTAASPGNAALDARYPTHPGDLDWDEVEGDGPERASHDERERARAIEAARAVREAARAATPGTR